MHKQEMTSDIVFLMEKAGELFPGIQKVIGIASIEHRIRIYQLESETELIEELSYSDNFQQKTIEKMRESNRITSWHAADDLPFSIQAAKQNQKMMFDELSNVVLCIPFVNSSDHKYDQLFIYFNQDFSNFGINLSSTRISTETKNVIAYLCRQSLKLHLENQRSTEAEFAESRENIQVLIQRFQHLKEEKNKQVDQVRNRILEFAKRILKDLSKRFGYNAEFTKEAADILQNWNGNLWDLSAIIGNAFDFARKLGNQHQSPLLRIEDWHLDLNNITSATENEEIAKVSESKYLKTYALLERLEEAARRVASDARNLTGSNVGTAMNQPISAAAITDAIKKNQGKIRTLLQQFPDKWKIIRSEFKPITNILEVKADFKSQVG